MPHEGRDPSYLYDMLDSARALMELTRGVALAAFLDDRKLYRAVEREIEIVGEAARRVSAELKAEHGEIPWAKIVATRHRLAHEYDHIRLEIIYRIATVHIPMLVGQLEAILQTLPPDLT